MIKGGNLNETWLFTGSSLREIRGSEAWMKSEHVRLPQPQILIKTHHIIWCLLLNHNVLEYSEHIWQIWSHYFWKNRNREKAISRQELCWSPPAAFEQGFKVVWCKIQPLWEHFYKYNLMDEWVSWSHLKNCWHTMTNNYRLVEIFWKPLWSLRFSDN